MNIFLSNPNIKNTKGGSSNFNFCTRLKISQWRGQSSAQRVCNEDCHSLWPGEFATDLENIF